MEFRIPTSAINRIAPSMIIAESQNVTTLGTVPLQNHREKASKAPQAGPVMLPSRRGMLLMSHNEREDIVRGAGTSGRLLDCHSTARVSRRLLARPPPTIGLQAPRPRTLQTESSIQRRVG